MNASLVNTKKALFFMLMGLSGNALHAMVEENLVREPNTALTAQEVLQAMQDPETYKQLGQEVGQMSSTAVQKVGDGVFDFVTEHPFPLNPVKILNGLANMPPKPVTPATSNEVLQDFAQKESNPSNAQTSVEPAKIDSIVKNEEAKEKFSSIKNLFAKATEIVTKERVLYSAIALSSGYIISYGAYLAYKKYVCGIPLSKNEKKYLVRAGAVCSAIIAASSAALIIG